MKAESFDVRMDLFILCLNGVILKTISMLPAWKLAVMQDIWQPQQIFDMQVKFPGQYDSAIHKAAGLTVPSHSMIWLVQFL